jgi:cell division septation protein DedD
VLSGVLSSLGAADAAGITQFPGGISGVIGSAQTVKALITALQSDSRARILSSPSILATDNRPARIQVGSEEPIATGQVTSATGAANNLNSSTTIQYRNTGRIVTIIPQVNSQGLVNLQILAEVSQRGVNVIVGDGSFPSFDTRQAETTAVVQHGETLAIGGIITDNKNRSRSGIPYLMDIPVFGRFFGRTSDEIDRTELIMLITPNVIRNRTESQVVTEEFKSKLSTVRSELERIKREQDRELERLKKRAPAEPEDTAPDQPADKTPSPGASTPEQQSPVPPSNPAPNPAPGRGAMSAPPKPRGSDASEKIQSAPPREPIEIRLQGTPQQQSRAPVPSTATAEIYKSPPSLPTKGEAKRAAASPGFATLAKLAATEAVKPQGSAPAQVWAVQIVSYARESDARVFAAKLKQMGYNVTIMSGEAEGQPRYRVEIGPLPSRSRAEELQRELATVHKLDQAFILTRWTDSGIAVQPR